MHKVLSRDHKCLQDDKSCRFDESKVKAKISDWFALTSGDEENLKAAVSIIGPISCGMEATLMSFFTYGGGKKASNNVKHIYSRPSLSRLRLSRITAYLEEKSVCLSLHTVEVRKRPIM